jgi:hypothetical protein
MSLRQGKIINKSIGALYFNNKSNIELDKYLNSLEFITKYNIKRIDYGLMNTFYKNFFYRRYEIFVRKVHSFLHLALIWQNREATLNFKLKAYNMIGSNRQAYSHPSFTIYEKLRLPFLKRVVIRIIGNVIGITLIKSFLLLLFEVKNFFEPNILKNLDCLIIMHGGRISFEQDFLIWQSKSKSIKTIAIQENWDNLSSKTILFQHPDYFATWGKQSSAQLIKIHNFKGGVNEIGSIRLSGFHHYRNKNLGINHDKTQFLSQKYPVKTLLIIGSGDGEHDFIIAKECMRLINHCKEFLTSEFKLIYRPHPYSLQLEKNCQKISKLGDVSINRPSKNELDNYRISLILNSDLVISLYSTMVLESCILNKLCVIPSFLNIKWNFDTSNFLDQAEHYLGMSSFESLINLKSDEEFQDILLAVDKNEFTPINNSGLINWFCADVDSVNELSNFIDTFLLKN